MSVHRIMGIETEYGIHQPMAGGANHSILAHNLISEYAKIAGLVGVPALPEAAYEKLGADENPQVLWSEHSAEGILPAVRLFELADIPLTNGGRFYVDHAHPEYSSPEVTTPIAAITWDKAGEAILAQAASSLERAGHPAINLYKNNTDGKGVSYGTHENYLVPRALDFSHIIRGLTPFLVTRQIFCGAGGIRRSAGTNTAGFQLSSRAEFIEVEVGLETTLRRPIINTRDEPHAAADKYRRLHIILGDANLAEVASVLKMGTTALVLAMIEDDFLPRSLELSNPVAELHNISNDPTLKYLVEYSNGTRAPAIDIQWTYFELASKYLKIKYSAELDSETQQVMQLWESTLTKLSYDPMECVEDLDWVAKYSLLQAFRDREQLDWDHAKLKLIDLQYSDVRSDRGLYHRLLARGRMTRLIPATEIIAAMTHPPKDTRAYFRGECLAKYREEVTSVSWDSIIFGSPEFQQTQKILLTEPRRGTQKLVEELLASCPTSGDLIRALGGK